MGTSVFFGDPMGGDDKEIGTGTPDLLGAISFILGDNVTGVVGEVDILVSLGLASTLGDETASGCFGELLPGDCIAASPLLSTLPKATGWAL